MKKIPKWKALAVLSSDALSSVAYATEEIIIPLALFSVAATAWSIPVALAIVLLLIIVSASYRQTIEAYPSGGGAYGVAKENIGTFAGLTAAAALLIGYILTVAVSIAAGVGALTSAFPALASFKVVIGAFMILLVTLLNLRGVRESSTIFAFPTYLFIFLFLLLIGVGSFRLMTGMDVPTDPVIHSAYPVLPLFLIFRAFSSGCAALTGIEAISNGVPLFRYPSARNAKITLTWMAVLLCILFFGITTLTHVYGILPQADEAAVSQLARSIFGEGPLYYLVQFSTALILFLAANTSYNGLPWLTAILSNDRYLPRQFGALGDRLVFSNSIIGLSLAAILLIWMFNGDPHALIPLYAVGVFLGFTLSQVGMLRHHLVHRKKGWPRAFAINLLGAITTFVVMWVVGATKFFEGAWVVAILIPLCVFCFYRIRRHYDDVGNELTLSGVEAPSHLRPYRHTAIVPISGVHKGVVEALRYALSISEDVRAVYVEIDPVKTAFMQKTWNDWGHDVPLVILKSPYRSIVSPLLEYLDDLEQTTHDDLVTVVIPEFVTAKWRHQLLHNQTALRIRASLLFKKRKVVTSVRYHLRST